jgi:DNA-binding NtrC family response regulator
MMELTLIGQDPGLRRLLKAAKVVAATDANVLLIGESGTGKEVLARSLHRWSPRATGDFVGVRCTGLEQSPDLPALCEQGLGQGTLFLDEVAELTPAAQAGLLRCLEVLALDRSLPAMRVIAATARDLGALVRDGSFRRDLYHRLCVVPLELPPLRERVGDIALLAEHFLHQSAQVYGLEEPSLRQATLRQLKHYRWPGNLRELRNLCERLVILLPGSDIAPDNLPAEIRGAEAPEHPGAANGNLGFRLPETGIDLKELEVEAIRQALTLAAGNKSRAARLLGLSRDTLLYRMRKHVIEV